MAQIGRSPIKLDKEQILRLYDSKSSSLKIGILLGVSGATIIRRLHKWNIPIRVVYPIWNKGLTAAIDGRVASYSMKITRMAGKKHTPQSKAKMSMTLKGKNTWSKGSKKSEETKKRNSEASKRLWQDPTYRANQIREMKDRWANPEYIARVRPLLIKGNQIKPSKPEQRLINIINKAQLPFRYTGDGSFMVQGLNPDFVNCNGAKIVIEVFGDYWHGKHARTWKEVELGRIMAFNSFGFKSIILWESEINNSTDAILVERIKNESARLSCLHGPRLKRKTRT